MAKLGRKLSRERGVISTAVPGRARAASPYSLHRHSGTRESAGPESITTNVDVEHDCRPIVPQNAISWLWIPRCALPLTRIASQSDLSPRCGER